MADTATTAQKQGAYAFYDPSHNEVINVENEGQKVLYLIRKAFKEGSMYAGSDIAQDVQVILNKPKKIEEADYKPSKEDQEFLQDIIKKVDSAKIQLYTPSSLLNDEVYQQLNSSGKAKADFDILNLLNKIREIKKLWDQGDKDTYQLFNLVHSLRITKERIETADGDVFII